MDAPRTTLRKAARMTDISPSHRRTPLPPGTVAPDFELPSTPDQKVMLSDFRGQPVILVFYPEDWSPVCSDQLGLYQAVLPEFQKHNAELLAISVDSAWSHLAFARDRNLHFPLLSDFEPKGEVSRVYEAYRTEEGTSARALFVLDADGVIRWSYVSPVGVNPGADGILRALEEIDGQETP
jgi:peroxiredoxin